MLHSQQSVAQQNWPSAPHFRAACGPLRDSRRADADETRSCNPDRVHGSLLLGCFRLGLAQNPQHSSQLQSYLPSARWHSHTQGILSVSALRPRALAVPRRCGQGTTGLAGSAFGDVSCSQKLRELSGISASARAWCGGRFTKIINCKL